MPLYSRRTVEREIERFSAILDSLPPPGERTAVEEAHARNLGTQIARNLDRLEEMGTD